MPNGYFSTPFFANSDQAVFLTVPSLVDISEQTLRQIQLAELPGPDGTIWQITKPAEEAANRLKLLKINKPPPILRFDWNLDTRPFSERIPCD